MNSGGAKTSGQYFKGLSLELRRQVEKLEGENEALKNEIAHLKLVISRFQTGGKG